MDPLKRENLESIIKKYKPKLKLFIRKRVSNEDDADDILQDVFYQLIKTIDQAVNPIEQMTAWLYRVAKNTIINKKKKKREVELPEFQDEEGNLLEFSEILSNDGSTPESEYLRSLVWEELETALSELASEQREAFVLMELEGLPAKEVAESLNIPVNTLLSRKHYAVKFLRNRLNILYKDILDL